MGFQSNSTIRVGQATLATALEWFDDLPVEEERHVGQTRIHLDGLRSRHLGSVGTELNLTVDLDGHHHVTVHGYSAHHVLLLGALHGD